MPTPRRQPAKRREPTMFEIDGKTLPFLFDVNAMIEVEEKFGKPIFAIAQEMANSPSLAALRAIVAAGLSDDDNVYSEKEAGEAIGKIGMVPFVEAFAASLEGVMGKPSRVAKPAG